MLPTIGSAHQRAIKSNPVSIKITSKIPDSSGQGWPRLWHIIRDIPTPILDRVAQRLAAWCERNPRREADATGTETESPRARFAKVVKAIGRVARLGTSAPCSRKVATGTHLLTDVRISVFGVFDDSAQESLESLRTVCNQLIDGTNRTPMELSCASLSPTLPSSFMHQRPLRKTIHGNPWYTPNPRALDPLS